VIKLAGIAYAVYLWFVVTWVLYLAVMNLKRTRAENLHWFVRWHAYALLGVGWALDLAVNVMASLLFLDPPREVLLTARLKRYRVRGGWRGTLAGWVCRHLLNPFDPDPDGHC